MEIKNKKKGGRDDNATRSKCKNERAELCEYCKSCKHYNEVYVIAYWACGLCKPIHKTEKGKITHIGSEWKPKKQGRAKRKSKKRVN